MNIDKMKPIGVYDKALLLRERCSVDFYLNEHSGFLNINCPTCEASNDDIIFYKYGFKHAKCNECDTLYVSSRPSEEKIFEWYTKYEATKNWTELLIKTNDERKYLQHVPRVEKLKKIINNSKNSKKLFVELGAGNGNFSKAISEANIFKDILATDISHECILSCNNQGLNTKQCTISDFEDNSIGCIVFNDLIEHVFSPLEFLKLCFSKLEKNGILMLSTPNGEGFDFKILKSETENITPPEHLQYFNPKSIQILLKKIGFEIIDISTPGILDVDIIKRQINNKGLNLQQNNEFLSFIYSLNDENLEKSFQKFIQENKLSSHMLVFVRKT